MQWCCGPIAACCTLPITDPAGRIGRQFGKDLELQIQPVARQDQRLAHRCMRLAERALGVGIIERIDEASEVIQAPLQFIDLGVPNSARSQQCRDGVIETWQYSGLGLIVVGAIACPWIDRPWKSDDLRHSGRPQHRGRR
jgi:hypothetical protein